MKLLGICCLLFCVGVMVTQADDDFHKTGNFLNGRWWNTLNSSQKVCWLVGFREGVAHLLIEFSAENAASKNQKELSKQNAADAFERLNRAVGGKFTFDEMATAIDGFYEDPANRQIPVVEAFPLMKRKFEGAAPDEIERLTARQRQSAQSLH